MKKYLLLLCFWPFAIPSKAQSVDEWLRQKETALKYAVEQLAALQSQSHILKKGYTIVATGLETLAAIKGSDYNLHHTFQASLKKLNPAIGNQAFLQQLYLQITWLQAQLGTLKTSLSRHHVLLTQDEKKYLLQVLQRLQEQVGAKAIHLSALGTTGEFVLNDAERVERMTALAQATREDLAFLKSFSGQTEKLLLQRRAEQAAIQHLQKIKGL